MTEPRTVFDDDVDAWLEICDHPEKYPWKQTGTRGLTIKTNCKNISRLGEVLICRVDDSRYAKYIVKLHNDALAASLQRGAGI